MEQTSVRAATAQDLKRNLEDMHIPRGTQLPTDYERCKRLLSTWLRELESHGITPPTYEACIRVVSDWVGV
jgi:hypothetical protein